MTPDGKLEIGDKIWCFRSERRIYGPPDPKNGMSRGGPIYREHWVQIEITGETSRSWITVYGKCPKAGGHGWALTQRDVDMDVWYHEHRHRVVRLVDRQPREVLASIAFDIGYEP